MVAIRVLNVNVLSEAIDHHLNIETPLSPLLSHCHKSNIDKSYFVTTVTSDVHYFYYDYDYYHLHLYHQLLL